MHQIGLNQVIREERSIQLTYRLDNIFNMWRLKARTKVSHENLYELQYADDCALVTHTPEDLHLVLTTLHQVYSELGP